jgi:hypothetical protein
VEGNATKRRSSADSFLLAGISVSCEVLGFIDKIDGKETFSSIFLSIVIVPYSSGIASTDSEISGKSMDSSSLRKLVMFPFEVFAGRGDSVELEMGSFSMVSSNPAPLSTY